VPEPKTIPPVTSSGVSVASAESPTESSGRCSERALTGLLEPRGGNVDIEAPVKHHLESPAEERAVRSLEHGVEGIDRRKGLQCADTNGLKEIGGAAAGARRGARGAAAGEGVAAPSPETPAPQRTAAPSSCLHFARPHPPRRIARVYEAEPEGIVAAHAPRSIAVSRGDLNRGRIGDALLHQHRRHAATWGAAIDVP